MARNGTVSREIEKYFKDNQDKEISVSKLMRAGKTDASGARGAVSYLRKKFKEGTGEVYPETVKRGHAWVYRPNSYFLGEPASNQPPEFEESTTVVADSISGMASERLRQMAEKLTEPVLKWDEEEAQDLARPVVIFTPVGTTDDGHTIVVDNGGKAFKIVAL